MPGAAPLRYLCRPCWLGVVLVAADSHGIRDIALGDSAAALTAELRRRAPGAQAAGAGELAPLGEAVMALLAAPWRAPGAPALLRSAPVGTAFQRRVWQALTAVAPGRTVSYGALARALGQPGAGRAVAGACAANRLAVLVPCHRVMGSAGRLCGYRWGVSRKRALLECEAEALRSVPAAAPRPAAGTGCGPGGR